MSVGTKRTRHVGGCAGIGFHSSFLWYHIIDKTSRNQRDDSVGRRKMHTSRHDVVGCEALVTVRNGILEFALCSRGEECVQVAERKNVAK